MTSAACDLLEAVFDTPFEETPRCMLIDELSENPYPGCEEFIAFVRDFFPHQNPDDYPYVVHCPVRLLTLRTGRRLLRRIEPNEIHVLGPKTGPKDAPFRWGFNRPGDNVFDERYPFLLPACFFDVHHEFVRRRHARLYPGAPPLAPAACPRLLFRTPEDAHRHLSILAMMLVRKPD